MASQASISPDIIEAYGERPWLWRAWRAYRLVLRRRYLLYRAIRARHDLRCVSDRTAQIKPGAILCFVTMRDEADRIAYFLDHHRSLGVTHFLVVDNDSTDATADLLKHEADVSLWHSAESYRAARFGVSWLTWLQIRFGAGHWCLTLDCDELLIIPHHDQSDLVGLIGALEQRGASSFRTLMIELFPKGPIGQQPRAAGQNPVGTLPYFDAGPFSRAVHPEFHSLVEKGGVRARYFFDNVVQDGPPMHKTPLVRWSRRYAYADSTHTILPRHLNRNYGENAITGALLHTKFLPSVVAKSADPAHRAQHFAHPDKFETYYDTLTFDPDLWHPKAAKYEDWRQLQRLGLMSDGGWNG